MKHFREAQEDVAKMREFEGNVIAIPNRTLLGR